MTENETAAELARVRTQSAELFLSNHAEKHDAEKQRQDEAREAHTGLHLADARALETALNAETRRLEEHRISHNAAHGAHEDIHVINDRMGEQRWVSHASEHESIAKNLSEYKAQSNEWRGSLSDLRLTFASKAEVENLETQIRAGLEAIRQDLATEREERRDQQNLRVGAQKGISQSTAIIVGAITLVGIILGIIVAVANFATGT
jgi:hypothetical protein